MDYALGALRFSITGDDAVARCVADEFAVLRTEAEAPPHINFRFVNELPPMAGATLVDPLAIAEQRFALSRNGIAYCVSRHDDGLHVHLMPVQAAARHPYLPGSVARFIDWNYLTVDEIIAKNFAYDVFDYLSQITQLPLGQTHLHASAFERDGVGVAIIAWGGVGKTTAMLKFVLEEGWRYLSDDLVTIDRNATLWRSPKRLQVYGYNIEHEVAVRRALMKGRGAKDRAAWAMRLAVAGPKRVRRRISAEQLFGHSAAVSAPLRHAIYIERVDTDLFSVRDLSVSELVERAVAAVMKELQPFIDLSLAMHSSGRHAILPSVEAMYEETRAALMTSFRGVQPVAVGIPRRAGPTEVANRIRAVIGGSRVGAAAP